MSRSVCNGQVRVQRMVVERCVLRLNIWDSHFNSGMEWNQWNIFYILPVMIGVVGVSNCVITHILTCHTRQRNLLSVSIIWALYVHLCIDEISIILWKVLVHLLLLSLFCVYCLCVVYELQCCQHCQLVRCVSQCEEDNEFERKAKFRGNES